MSEKKPKSIESELYKKAARPNTAPIVNKKTQQKKKKKKNPQADKKNLQKLETQRFKSALSKITHGIVFSEKSIFQSVDISSEVHTTKKSVTYTVMIQPVLKNHNIGHVKETVLIYSKNWTVDMMKKEILDVLKRDSYDFIPDKETEMDIKRRILDIIKSHPDVVISKKFIPYTDWFCSRYFWLANAVINDDVEKGEPIRHKLTNTAISQSGEISFQYYQLPFVYKNGKIGTRKNYGQKQTAKFINENAEELRKCLAFQQNNKDKKKSIKIIINNDSMHITIGFGDKSYKKNMTGMVDFVALETWDGVVTEEYYEEKKALKKKVESRLKKLKTCGSLLHRTILKMVAEREGEEWPEKDEYEWEEKVITEEIYKVMGSGVSNMVSSQEITDAVADLINCGLLRKKTMKKVGKNGRFSEMFLPGAKNTILLPGTDYKVFAEMPFERKYCGFNHRWTGKPQPTLGCPSDIMTEKMYGESETPSTSGTREHSSRYHFTDMDWIDWLQSYTLDDIDLIDLTSDSNTTEALSLLEHRCVAMLYPSKTREFLRKMPPAWMEYAETMYEITDDEGERRYWKIVQNWLS